MGEPAVLEGKQLADVVDLAVRIVESIRDDEDLPADADKDALQMIAIALVTVTDGGVIDGRVERKGYLRNLRARVDLERRVAELEARNAKLEQMIHADIRIAKEGAKASLAADSAPRRAPAAGEVLPPEQRASWARERTEHDK